MESKDSNSLEHFGVQGMKWGVRKRSAKEEKERAKRFKAVKNRRTLPDEEIKARIERIQAEKKLKQLVEEDLTPGRAVAKRIMSDSGQKVARNAVAGAGTLAIGIVVGTVFGPDTAKMFQRGGIKK